MKYFNLLVLQILFATGAFAQEVYYVSPKGNNNSNGKSNVHAFQTVQHAIDEMDSGDKLMVMNGYYSGALKLKSGITIEAINPRKVTFSGAALVKTDFKRIGKAEIYKADIGDKNIKQLFFKNKPMTWAQWPNIRWAENWNASKKWKSATDGTGPGILKSNDFSEINSLDLIGGYCFIRYGKGNSCYSRRIKSFGGKTLKWNDKEPDFYDKKYTGEDGPRGSKDALLTLDDSHEWHPNKSRFFLAGALDLLDTEGEWFFKDDILYFWPPEELNPNSEDVVVSTLDYVINEVKSLSNITFEGIDFFATSVKLEHNDNENIIFKNTHFNYIGGELLFKDRIHADSINRPIRVKGTNIEFEKCLFAGAQNAALSLEGGQITVNNCVFMENNRHGNFESRALAVLSKSHYQITNNTFFNNCSDAMMVRAPRYNDIISPEISRNNIFNAGLYNSDVSGIYMPSKSQHYLNIHHNWVHNVYGNAIRLDLAGSELIVHHNVLWENKRGLNIEGYSKFYIYNNTAVHEENSSSITRNIIAHHEESQDLANEVGAISPLKFPPIKEWDILNNIVEGFQDRVGPREVPSYDNALKNSDVHDARKNSRDITVKNRNKVRGNLIGGISNVFTNYNLNNLNLIPKNNANNISSDKPVDRVQEGPRQDLELDNFRGAYESYDSDPWYPGSDWMPLNISVLRNMKMSQDFASNKKNKSYIPAVPKISENSLSVQETQKSKVLIVSPNPVKDRFTIELDKTEKSASLFIYGVTGKLIYQKEFSNVSTIKLEGSVLIKGVNTLRVLTDKVTYSARLIKE